MITTNISVQDKVRNYQGENRFLLGMKEALNKWGNLTVKQLEASEKALNSQVKSDHWLQIDKDNLPEDLKRILAYNGESTFVKDIASKFQKYGTLTSKQITAAVTQIQKEEDAEKTLRMKWPTPGETIQIGRKIGQQLKEKYGLQFNPILIDIVRLRAISPRAIQFEGKLTIKRGKVCTCCMKTLTDEFSMLTGLGKICAGHLKIPYITDVTQAERFREDYLKRVEEIGVMEFWIPKSQIKKWEGDTQKVLLCL